jgi:hypothetical protein
MLSYLSGGASTVLSYVSNFIPQPIADRAATVRDVAQEVIGHFSRSQEARPQPLAAGGAASGMDLIEFRPQRTQAFYKELSQRASTAYEKTAIVPALRLKPKVSQAIPIKHYLTLLSNTKITHKIYEKLKSKWGYHEFFRVLQPGSEGLATAFIAHILLEDAARSPSIGLGKLIRFYTPIIADNKIPAIVEPLRASLDALRTGGAIVTHILSHEDSPFLHALVQGLVLSYYESNRLSSELSVAGFVASLQASPKKDQIQATLTSLEGFALAPLIPLLGPKQSFLGLNPMPKFVFIMTNLNAVLERVKFHLKARIDNASIIEWIDSLTPMKLLTCFEEDALGVIRKDALMPLFLDLFKQELVRVLTPNSSLFLEGFSFSKRASSVTHLETIAEEISLLDGTYLAKLFSIDPRNLFNLAEVLENYEEALSLRQVQFAEYLSRQFDISFVLHSWQLSQQDKKRLKIQHVGQWNKPTCHLVLYPENNLSRVDLLKPHGVYAPRHEMVDLIRSSSFLRFKRHGSETLALISKEDASLSPAEKLLAKHFLYFRLHVFASIHKLMHLKLPKLSDPAHFDMYGSKEDDLATHNPFGEEPHDLLPEFQTEIELSMFKLEKHIMGLNREIAEISYIADCVFSHTKHEEILLEIQQLLKAAKKATKQFYMSKIPNFLAGFDAAIASLSQEVLRDYTRLKASQAAYATLNPSKAAAFNELFTPATSAHLTTAQLVPLIPRLSFDTSPPDVFLLIDRLRRVCDTYFEAHSVNLVTLQEEINTLFLKIKGDGAKFIGFYAAKGAEFRAIFDQAAITKHQLEALNTLIPKEKVAHADLKGILQSMNQLSSKLKKLQDIEEIRSLANQTRIRELMAQILAKKADFMTFNSSKEAMFDRSLAKENILEIARTDLVAMRHVSAIEHENAPLYIELKYLHKKTKKIQALRKEQTQLAEKYAAMQARAALEEDGEESDAGSFPDAGSLGPGEGDSASLGGASFGSDLQSIGSLERWVESLL